MKIYLGIFYGAERTRLEDDEPILATKNLFSYYSIITDGFRQGTLFEKIKKMKKGDVGRDDFKR